MDQGLEFGFDSLIDQFKKDLVNQISEDQSMTNQRHFVIDIVEKLLPKQNFFAYKRSKYFSKQMQE